MPVTLNRSTASLNVDVEKHFERCRLECRRRIFAICDETAQVNLAAACAAGLLAPAQLLIYQSGLAWVHDMRAAWRPMGEAGADPEDDANWPAVPAGVADLAAEF